MATRVVGDACQLPFEDGAFDAVCAMDLLEHVADPARVIGEAARVLVPGGLFFFHTFNQTWLANLIVIEGVELFVANTPPKLHVLDSFITPAELTAMCEAHELEVDELRGLGYTGVARLRPCAEITASALATPRKSNASSYAGASGEARITACAR